VLVGLAVLAYALSAGHLDSVAWFQQMGGWCFPYASLLGKSTVLYTDGTHLALPPLSFVVLHWIAPHAPTRFDEDVLCRVTSLLAPIVLYLGTRRRLPARVAFLSAAGILALHPLGTLLYNQLCFLLACTGLVIALPAMTSRRSSRVRLALAALFLALAVLTKQSCGAGAVAGVALALALFPATVPWRRRLVRCGALLAATLAAVVVVGVALTPYLSFPGMIRDVLVHGSDPKGTRVDLLERLQDNVVSMARTIAWLPLAIPSVLLLVAFVWRRPARESSAEPPGWVHVAMVSAVGIVAALSPLLAWKGGLGVVKWLWSDAGLFLLGGERYWYLVVPAVVLLPLARRAGMPWAPPLIVASLPMYLAGMLSCPVVEWWSAWLDLWGRLWAPPLVFAGNAVALTLVTMLLARRTRWMLAAQLFLGLEMACPYWIYTWHPRLADEVYEPWPDVPALGAMKVRRELHGAHDAILAVRKLSDGPGDDVFWLPGDPPVEAYLERPRPALSSPLVFMDQYDDRYVDQDVEALLAHPPKLIVLGPFPKPHIWPYFRREEEWGTMRLIDRVQRDLLPGRYERLGILPWPDPKLTEGYLVYRRRR